MRFLIRNQGFISWLLIILLIPILACSKTGSGIVGKWKNENSPSSIEFYSNKTGVIHQTTHAGMARDLTFRWTMLNAQQFEIVVNIPGSSKAETRAVGKLEGNDTLVLQEDTFKKMK